MSNQKDKLITALYCRLSQEDELQADRIQISKGRQLRCDYGHARHLRLE